MPGTVVGALDTVISILNDTTFLVDPHPTRTADWWHDTPPDPKLTFPRGYVRLANHNVEKISIGTKYCARHTVTLGLRIYTKGEGRLATAFEESSVIFKSDRFLLLYLQKVDDGLARAQTPILFPAGYKGYKAIRMSEPLPTDPIGWTAEMVVQLQFFRAMGE